MRAFWALLAVVLLAIGSGVGVEAANVATGPKATFRTAVESLDASPYAEMAFSIKVPNKGESAAVISEARSAVVTVDLASADGSTFLSNEKTNVSAINEQISVSDEGSDLVDIRVVGGQRLYFRFYLSAMAKLPSVPASARSTLGDIGAIVGGSWFAIPTSLIKGLAGRASAIPIPKTVNPSSPQVTKILAAERRLETDILNVTQFSSSSSPLGTVTSASASLKNLGSLTLRDFGPVVSGILPKAPGITSNAQKAFTQAQKAVAKAQGRVVAKVVTDGSGIMDSANIAATVQGQTVSLHAAINHQSLNLGVPVGARSIPSSIIKAIERQFASKLLD